jgi:hypothetical protein
MASTIERPAGWVLRKAGAGLRELPRNASWLVSKARPGGNGDSPPSAEPEASETTSVDNLLRRADEAAEAARAAELRAVALAEEARDRAEEANRVAEEASAEAAARLQEAEGRAREREEAARREADEAVAEVIRIEARRVRRAQHDMDVRVERERQRAWSEAQQTIERVRGEAEERAGAARQEAEEAERQAHAALEEARSALTQASALSGEAAAAAEVAAHYAGARATELATVAAATPDTEPANGDAPSTVTVTEVTVDEVTIDLDAAESEV